MDSPIKYEELMGKIKIFKEVSQKIIAFLAQLEDLQKKLWEKKKFVIETNYCITLDKIDEDYYKEIFACKEQLAEWKELFNVNVRSVDDLKEEKYLVLDTKFFDMKFKYKLLSEFDNLDEDIDGVLINSENFGALTLLQNRYKEQVKTVYIDPPYNTGNDGFLYNDGFSHSSWMTFMYDRLTLGRELMSDKGIFFSSIDYRENYNLKYLLDSIYPVCINELSWKKYSGVKNNATNKLTTQHETIYFYGMKNFKFELAYNPLSEKYIKDEYKYKDENGRIYAKLRGRSYQNKDGIAKIKYLDEVKGSPITTLWAEKELQLNTSDAEKIHNFFSYKFQFDGQKPTKLIQRIANMGIKNNEYLLDYFAGSGTTGHAVINLNREDNGTRKYILVEMGEYFDSVTKPRIQKVIYSDSWKDGKPTTKNGISQIFKYFKLESYEDTLNNLEFTKTKEQEDTLGLYSEVKEDYILNYSLDVESQASLLNIDTFSTPFDYKLKIATSSVGETKDTNIDLVETFNYLLGLAVKRIEIIKGYLIVEGSNLSKERILVIWRNGQSNKELNDFFQTMDWNANDSEFHKIYVNGDNNLSNLRTDENNFKVSLIENEFKTLMFGK